MENIIVSATPHVRSKDSIQTIMRDVLIALAPATIMGIVYFGFRALLVVAISVASAVVFEYLYQKLMKKTITITDCSAAVTGLLLAMNLPSTVPFYVPIVGAFVAIIITKQLFGGLGQNFMNPALAGRAFLVAAYPSATTGAAFGLTNFQVDATTTATPLALIKESGFAATSNDIVNALIGNIGGCIGETCAIALILGGLYLIFKKVISWRIPVIYIATVFVLSFAFGRPSPVYELFIGGLMLGAFFMATDYASSPVTPQGQIIMALGCGILTALIRSFGGYPEGVSYSILLMNLCVPLIDRFTKPKIFGAKPKEAKQS